MVNELAQRMKADKIFATISDGKYDRDSSFPNPTDFGCLKEMVSHFTEECGGFTDYSLQYSKYLVKECEDQVDSTSLKARISNACHQ
mmetsp:Transcript_42998/g.41364  ORF Transcript_42998/g.41364 Transcript_42998/m.41364 type:complete len:87 (+) Transcript_42998:262-522(+)